MAGNTILSLLVKLGVDSAGFEKSMSEAKKSTSGFEKVAGGLAKKLMMVAGPAVMGKVILSSAKLAARVETLAVVTQTLGRTAGYSSDQISAFEKSIAKQGITTQNTRQAMAQMMQAQIDLAEGTNLARLAQDTAVIANINSSEAFTRLVTVLQTGNVRMGRTMGLNLAFGKAQEELAKKLGITTSELNEQQVMQSRLNELKRAGAAIEGTYEAAMETTGKQMLSMDRHMEELSLVFGEIFLPVLGAAVGGITKFAKELKAALEIIKELANRGKVTEDTFYAQEKAVRLTAATYDEYNVEMEEALKATGRTLDMVQGIRPAYALAREELEWMTEAQWGSYQASQPFIEGFRLMEEAMSDASYGAEFVGAKFEASYVGMRNASEAARNYAGGLDAITKAAEDAGQSVDTNLVSSIEQFIEDQEWVAAGGGELLAVLETLETAEGLTALEKVAFAEELLADAEAWETNLKDSENIIGQIDTKLGSLPSEIDILINIRTTGEESRFQHGGSMTVPPGFPNDSYPIFVSSGEHVQVTPSGGSSYDQSDNRTTNIGPVNIGSGDDEWAFLDKLKRITARS